MAVAEDFLEWVHSDDRRRGGEQRRESLPPTGSKVGSAHPDGHHRNSGRDAGRNCLSGASVSDRRHAPGRAGYQSVLSMLVAAVAGKNAFYYVTMGSILLVLALSANTAFADFPRLCRAIAEDCYLPMGFASRGRRLVYSQGIGVLAVLC